MNSPALALTGETLRRRCNVRAKKKRSGDGGIMILLQDQMIFNPIQRVVCRFGISVKNGSSGYVDRRG